MKKLIQIIKEFYTTPYSDNLKTLNDKQLIDIINLNQREGHHYYQIPSFYKTFKKRKRVKKLGNRTCYLNSLLVAKQNKEYQLAIGFSVTAKGSAQIIDITSHAWNIKDGIIEDFTYGYDSDIYLGRILHENEIQKLNDGVDVRDFLFKECKFK